MGILGASGFREYLELDRHNAVTGVGLAVQDHGVFGGVACVHLHGFLRDGDAPDVVIGDGDGNGTRREPLVVGVLCAMGNDVARVLQIVQVVVPAGEGDRLGLVPVVGAENKRGGIHAE